MILNKLVKKGVQVGAEYREHRKEVKLSRENSEQDVTQQSPEQQNVDQFLAGPSSGSQAPRSVSGSVPQDAPPAYTAVAGHGGDRSISSGQPASDDKKAALAQYEDEDDDSSDDDLSTEDDEADWELDEAMDRQDSYPSDKPPEYRPVDDLVRDVLTTTNVNSHLPPNFERTPIPCPVIIPQRRPRKKERGFIRAYAPLLGECSGIDQATFLAFLENFHKSSQASPVWTVIQVSAGIAGLAPSVIAMAVTTAASVAAGVAKEVQTRHRTNDFLDQINEQLFKPAGLFAMIVKYKTSAEVANSENSVFRRLGVATQQVDFSTGQAVAKYDRNLSSEEGKSMTDRMKNIRLASGTTKGAIELPEAAPLVFPEVDKAIVSNGPETFKDKAKDAKMFLADYMDRRAQMEYSRQDPNSGLSVPEDKRTMKSKYADDSHPMYNSGLIGLVSGGHLAGRGRGGHSRSRSRGRYDNTTAVGEAYGRPSLYDSSRLYSAGDVSRRDMRRYDNRERRALRTEQRMAEGRRVGRRRERRYEDFLYQQDSMYGGDAELRHGRMGGRRGRGGPIGMLIGAAGAAMEGGRQSQGSTSSAPAPHAPYGGSGSQEMYRSNPPAPYGSNPPAPYGGSAGVVGDYGASRPAAHARGGRRSRGQNKGALGMVKRIMQEDVLYLMIVNMPSEAELAEAREAITAAKAAK